MSLIQKFAKYARKLAGGHDDGEHHAGHFGQEKYFHPEGDGVLLHGPMDT
ncbi:hypothetical protein Tco_1039831, partial [Tanacetum coccineum]